MKIRCDFVTNSSSTSFVIITSGEFNLMDFIDSIGINQKSAFIDIFTRLFEIFRKEMQPARSFYEEDFKSDYPTFEEFIAKYLWNGKELLPKILEAEKAGKQVFIGRLDSETDETECFFCTDEFIIEKNDLYIDARENAW